MLRVTSLLAVAAFFVPAVLAQANVTVPACSLACVIKLIGTSAVRDFFIARCQLNSYLSSHSSAAACRTSREAFPQRPSWLSNFPKICADWGFHVALNSCICTDPSFQLNYYNCQTQTCSASDLAQAEEYGVESCAANGTPINVSAPPAGFNGTANATTSASGSAAPAASSRAAATGSVAASSAAAVASKPASAGRLAVAGSIGALIVGGVALLI
ncbi:hypothetical protein P7C70_g8833, partial [Phenoliferia sp. Uapishka_3]